MVRKESAPITVAADLDLLDAGQACRLFGGISKATLYRGVADERYPAPIKIGPNVSRWVRSEVEAAIRRLIEARAA